MLAWLLILVTDDPGTNAKRLFIATAFLGLSLYTYIGALITAPICVALTLLWLALGRSRRDWGLYGVAIAGFVVPALPFAAWHVAHPGQYAESDSHVRVVRFAHCSTPPKARGS